MKKTIWICDRCGNEFKYIVGRNKTWNFLLLINMFDDGEEADLCDECRRSLEKWWRRENGR